MKQLFSTFLAISIAITSNAQIGVGTTTPNSMLDVRGSISTAYRAFTANTSATAADHLLVFTGSSAATVTLPTAVGCSGRSYLIKNTGTATPVLTVATTSAQTIDGAASWSLSSANETITLISNGANWNISSQGIPGASGTTWNQNGNSVGSVQTFGTNSNFDLPFVTNNTEKMRLGASGSLGIGASAFNATSPEKLLVDAGTTTSVNAIVGKGTIDSYLQLNIQNNSAGTSASSDVVATANNGSETTNYVDMGVNGGSYSGGVMGAANDGYLYNLGQNMLIAAGTAAKSLVFMTGGTSQSTNERMRIDGTGNIGMGTITPGQKLDVVGNMKLSGAFMPGNSAGTSGFLLQSNGAGAAPTWVNASAYGWLQGGNSNSALQKFGTISNFDIPFITNNTERMRLSATGNFKMGTSAFNVTSPERFLVDAGVTTSVNAIVGKGTIDSYLQLNIQNNSAGTSASSDVVATANNGSETTNFVDMGVNGGNYSGGVMGAANDGYLYNLGQNLLIATGTADKSVVFMTGGTSQAANERMRIDGTGNIGMGTTTPGQKLDVVGNMNLSGAFMPGNQAGTSGFTLQSTGAGSAPIWVDASAYGWMQSGNNITGTEKFGSINNFDIPFITNNTERMRLSNTGNLKIGASAFNATSPEKLLVDAGTTTSVNAIVGKGSIDSYLQLNIQNNSAGTSASSDVVATANNGSETDNYVDMGVNGGSYSGGVMGAANDGYLYNLGQNLLIATGTAAKSLVFMTGGTSQLTNERMRIDGTGNIGMGTTTPGQKLDVVGNMKLSGAFMPGNSAGTSGYLLQSNGAGAAPTWVNASSYGWLQGGNSNSALQKFGTISNFDIPFITNNTERMRLSATGNFKMGTSAFNVTNPERFLVDAGVTTSVNAIVGKGSIDSYLQLNIQNNSAGTSASSDVVATANNGSETDNYIDMGVNGGSYSGGVMGAANDGYLYNLGQNLLIATGTATKSVVFMTGGTSQSTNERMRIDGTGKVGIGTNAPTSTLQVTGSTSHSLVTKTAAYTLTANDYTVLCNNTGSITITLPAASTANGRVYVIKKISVAGNNVTLAGSGAEVIDGAATQLLSTQYQFMTVQCDGTGWYVISKN